MDRNITRRDFLNGFSVAVGGGLAFRNSHWTETFGLPESPLASEKTSEYYPPALAGMRGTTNAVMEVGHALRDGNEWSNPTADPDRYDLVIVGGGISGLSAAYFYRQTHGPNAKILILENHDDFGGHARRNEYHTEQRMILGYGGTQSIAGPKLYSKESKALLAGIGVETQRFYKYFDRSRRGRGRDCALRCDLSLDARRSTPGRPFAIALQHPQRRCRLGRPLDRAVWRVGIE